MSKDPYERLRELMNEFPIGFPKTESGVEIKILRRLFTEEEVEIAVLLSPIPEEASRIAARAGRDEAKLTEKLERMADKGLIFRMRREGKTLFNMAAFMIGLYEYSVKRIDEELAGLFKEYYEAAMVDELASAKVPGFKVIPIAQHVAEDRVLQPFHKLEGKIREARRIAVTDCICRKEAQLLGHGCRYPVENCLSFGVAAEYYIDSGMGREIEAEEALRILKEADESGLVHAGANSKHLSNICNCCPCCCASLKAIVSAGREKGSFYNALYEAIIDEEECIACESCLERCPVGAIRVEETAITDRDKCLGCGLCASVCPSEAISLHLRPDRQEPFDRVTDMGMAMLEAKKRRIG
jgi:electron transport complex protein RnfB